MKALSLLLLTFGLTFSAWAKPVGGVNLPDTLTALDTSLVLNGAGIRTKWWIKLYVGGLYLKKASQDAKMIVDSDEAMAIRLHIISSHITNEKMEAAVREGFQKSMNGNITPLQVEIEQILSVFKETIKEDDVFEMLYLPGQGVNMSKNQVFKINVKGLEFKKALFGIWLSHNPVDSDLKEEMLGE